MKGPVPRGTARLTTFATAATMIMVAGAAMAQEYRKRIDGLFEALQRPLAGIAVEVAGDQGTCEISGL